MIKFLNFINKNKLPGILVIGQNISANINIALNGTIFISLPPDEDGLIWGKPIQNLITQLIIV